MMRLPLIAALMGALVLSACGAASDNPLRSILTKNLKQLTSKRGTQQVLTTEILRARLTPEVRAQIGVPVLIVELPKQKVAAVVGEVARNGGVITWWAEDGVGVSTKSGLLLSTRGVGFDLMSSEVAGPLALITGRKNGTALREHRFLDGENQEVLLRFSCTYLSSKSHVVESCARKDLKIENHYWFDQNGEIWRSKQWAGVRNGYMFIENPPG